MASKGDTTLKGATATARRIDADVGGRLNIESVQDHIEQDNQQSGAGVRVQVSFGTAWEASGNFSQSKASGSSDTVSVQSGLFAGDGGYHINADSVHLKGGAIVSTAPKEQNELTANRLTFENIQNQSSYQATNIGLSGGYGKNPDKEPGYTGGSSFSPSLPQYEKGSDGSTTYAALSEGRLNIAGKDTTVQELGIHSDSSSAHRAVAALPDLAKITEKQQVVAKATTDIVSAARSFSSNRQKAAAEDKAQAQAEFEGRLKARKDGSYEAFAKLGESERQAVLISGSEAYRKADTEARNWGIGGSKSRAANAGTTLVTGILGGQSNLQTAANTLSPYAAAAIGNTFGHGANQNETAQLAGHFLLGATLAYINGGDPLSGGSAAVAAEKAAQYLSQQYHDGKTAIDPQTGRFNPNLLPEQIKEDIKAAAGVIASIVGATGDNGAALNAQIGGVLGQNAVENNTALARYQNRVNLHENIADVTDPFGILTPLYNIKNALGDLNKLKDESRRKDQDKINQNIQEYLQKHGIKIHLNTAYEEVNGQGVTRLDTEGNRKVLTKALQEFAQASATTHATFRAEKMRLGIPTTMQPTAVRRVPLMEKDYFTGKDRQKTDSIRQPIFATEYLFIINGKNYVIQNHSAGHDFGELSGRGNQAAHFNSKQLELTTYTVSGKVNADVWKQEKDMPHNRQTYTPSKITGVTEHRYTKPSVNAKPSESFFKKPFLKRK